MFYPFNAAVAQRETQEFLEEYDTQQEVLLHAYLQIAHVHIERSCMRRISRARVYCPFSLYPQFESALMSAGFHVVDSNLPNNYIVSWE